ncbi:hypothetical protein T484DRAFT_1864610 [Baffinella frigidus]|nr:hypothetical protein T484DRAFT_1864610 [Cryptophyta sp. CCMP2293]
MTVLRDGCPEEPPGAGAPYFLDLSSTNGSWLNGMQIEGEVFYRLKDGDTLRFAHSER